MRTEKISERILIGSEQHYIRFGEIPQEGKSFDYGRKKPKKLKGVSAYRAHFNSDKNKWVVQPVNSSSYANGIYGFMWTKGVETPRTPFLVKGREVGLGPDGEPLLKNITVIKKLERQDVVIPGHPYTVFGSPTMDPDYPRKGKVFSRDVPYFQYEPDGSLKKFAQGVDLKSF